MAETQLDPIPTFADGAEGGTPLNAENLNTIGAHIAQTEKSLQDANSTEQLTLTEVPDWLGAAQGFIAAARFGNQVIISLDMGISGKGQPTVQNYTVTKLGQLPANVKPIPLGHSLHFVLQSDAGKAFDLSIDGNGVINIMNRSGATAELSYIVGGATFPVTVA